MCNLYRLQSAPDAIAAMVKTLGADVSYPEGIPNIAPGEVRITDTAPILRASSKAAAAKGSAGLEMVTRRWSWPNASGKPLFNLRSEGRRFPAATRCVALADGFYEFTAASGAATKRKDRWLFTWADKEAAEQVEPWFGIAAIFRQHEQVGEAYTLLTVEPGPDVAEIHHRQIVLLSPGDCLRWLDPATDAATLLRPSPAGTLVRRADPVS